MKVEQLEIEEHVTESNDLIDIPSIIEERLLIN
jgi:hypothetical protein